MRAWPELEVVAQQRGSDTQVSRPRECRVRGKPHQEHGQVSVGLESEGSARRRRLALLVVPACRSDDGARK